MLAAFLRNDNDPALATVAVMSGGLFNVFGDWIFVFPFYGTHVGNSWNCADSDPHLCCVVFAPAIQHFFDLLFSGDLAAGDLLYCFRCEGAGH